MFARIMAVVMTAILLTTVCLSAVWWLTLRNSQIDARLDYLISEAEEIAFLAGNLSGDNLMDTIRDRESVTRGYLNKLADKVNQEFGAYIAVMDRGGNVMTNSQKAYNEDPERDRPYLYRGRSLYDGGRGDGSGVHPHEGAED